MTSGRDSSPAAPLLVELPADLSSVRRARRFVEEQCRTGGVSTEQEEDAVLMTSELVTNAVLHGRSEVGVEFSFAAGVLRISVLDDDSRRPQPVGEDTDALGGRGLALVDALADRWGVEDRGVGKAVWFEVGGP